MADLAGLVSLVAPFFGLIALGFLCGKVVKLPAEGLAWMQFFVVFVALPPLFYRLIASTPLQELANWHFILATTLTTFCIFASSFVTGLLLSRGDLPQATLQGVAGSYSNIGYMGPPLVLAALGTAASPPVALIFVFDNALLFTLVPFLMTIGGVEKRSVAATAREVARRVVTHPFNIATAVGVLASYARFELPGFADKMVSWLANAAAPCALFILGVTVALRPMRKLPIEVPILVTVKLVAHPLLVWVVLSGLGDFDPVWVYAAVLMAALPPALNIFVLSAHYKVGMERASACILLGTVASMVTLMAFLWLIKTGKMPHDLFPS
ncbi:AEC family transporter [Chelatococcus sp. SYSU_G07232]|uniref:AEC family transporter n=1 Tax=Chelatococcus albus TaxID=3047466 RepID=A0ABT7ABY2_9HYPH|nr:AEC family transporter [Chelatococcus sp. SYSU_G07232]MDJ1156871.1 AEC family transporter [Chelatococcus sp. SYSU_G07232]